MENSKIVRPVYDERDDEIDTHSKSKAWDFVIAATQIFIIMCVVKGNPAWCGGLALLFLGMATNVFYRFDQYNKKSLFIVGVLLGAIGITLLIWFGCSGQIEGNGGNVVKIIEAVILTSALQKVAAILFVFVLLAIIYVKGKLSKMDEKQWDIYLRSISNRHFVILFFVSYSLPLLLMSVGGYFLYVLLKLTDPFLLAGLIFLFGTLKAVRKLDDNKKELWDKISKFNR